MKTEHQKIATIAQKKGSLAMTKDNNILIEVENLSKKFCKDLKTNLWYGVKDLSANVFGNEQPKELSEKGLL